MVMRGREACAALDVAIRVLRDVALGVLRDVALGVSPDTVFGARPAVAVRGFPGVDRGGSPDLFLVALPCVAVGASPEAPFFPLAFVRTLYCRPAPALRPRPVIELAFRLPSTRARWAPRTEPFGGVEGVLPKVRPAAARVLRRVGGSASCDDGLRLRWGALEAALLGVCLPSRDARSVTSTRPSSDTGRSGTRLPSYRSLHSPSSAS